MTAESEPAPEIAEFGESDEPEEASEPRRDFWAAFLGDRRLVPLLGGLAGVAAFGAMVGEWVTVSEPGVLFPSRYGVSAAGAIGFTFLGAVLLLAGALMVAIAGPAVARRTARVAGLGFAGATLLMLLAFRFGGSRDFISGGLAPDQQPEHTYGRGLTAAFAVAMLTGVALFLAGRQARTAEATDAVDEDATDPPALDWGWRRPRRPTAHPDAEPQPIELTVQPANPFARPDPDR